MTGAGNVLGWSLDMKIRQVQGLAECVDVAAPSGCRRDDVTKPYMPL